MKEPIVLMDYWGEDGDAPYYGTATIHRDSDDAPNETIRLLREAVRDATGRDVVVRPRQRMGFLP